LCPPKALQETSWHTWKAPYAHHFCLVKSRKQLTLSRSLLHLLWNVPTPTQIDLTLRTIWLWQPPIQGKWKFWSFGLEVKILVLKDIIFTRFSSMYVMP
jgi:hypothetical protein